MSDKHCNILLFGDQSSEKLSSIQNLVRNAKKSPAARIFLQKATDLVQLEFDKLNRNEHRWEHGFDSLLGMAEENEGEGSNGLVAAALSCVGRLGELIVHAERDPSILGLPRQPAEIIGLCTGLLPAAAAVAAKDTSDLIKLAPEIISITFRCTYEIWRRMQLIDDVFGCWVETYIGLPVERVQKILDEFHQRNNIPYVRRIAIGVIGTSWQTLFGCPTSMAQLKSWSAEMRNSTHFETPVGGCVHTKYMPKIDIPKVLGDSPLLDFPIEPTKARMASPNHCNLYKHTTLRGLLGEIVEDIANNVLHLDKTMASCVARLDPRQKVSLTVMGSTSHTPSLQLALKAGGITSEVNNYAEASADDMTRGTSGRIAIVGMSGRFPGNDTVEGFWDDLMEGKCHIEKIPKSRFDVDEYYDHTLQKKNSTSVVHGAWLKEPGLFDHKLFNISPREASQVDPIHRMLLTTSYEALQSAGYSPKSSLSTQSNRIATYFGQLGEDWHEIIHNIGADIYYVPGIARAFAPSRMNYHYKFGGGSFSLDSACASSVSAIVLACAALNARDCDMALAGGGSMIMTPTAFSGMSKSGMCSTTGGCRTFHDDADGYARGEGMGVVVLKRLEDACAENDNILGVIRASIRAYSTTTTSMTHPSHKSQERVYKEAFRQSCLDPEEISYVEMHGTGTQAGDYEEMTSVINVLAQDRSEDNPLTVGTVKAAVGHGEGAAGVTAVIKVLKMLRERVIPPQPGWPFKLNQSFPPLDPLNVRIPTQALALQASPKGEKKIKVLLNSFDASGGESCLVIEEPPVAPKKTADPRTCHIVSLSAKTATSLKANQQRLLDFLTRKPDSSLPDLAYTTTARRIHEPLRVAYVGSSTQGIIQQLQDTWSKAESANLKTKSRSAKNIFLFTGQGSAYSAMGNDLFQSNKTFREFLLVYQDIANSLQMPSFIGLISDRSFDVASASTTMVQLAIVALEIALASTLKIWGVLPDVVLGHSLGEYAALCVSGVLSVSDTLYLVGHRAMMMEKRLIPCAYAMLATSLEVDAAVTAYTELGLKSCDVSCKNAPSMTVISGTVDDMQKLRESIAANGEKATLLPVPYGFHSAQIDPVLDEMEEIMESVVFHKPQIPFISSLTGDVEREAETFSAGYLVRQAREPVNFVAALKQIESAGFGSENSLWFEMGPNPVCLGLARKTLDIFSSKLLPTVAAGKDSWQNMSKILKAVYENGVSVNWPEYHKNYRNSLTLLDLPKYAFDYKNFWIPFEKPTPVTAATSQDVVPKSGHNFAPTIPGFPTTSVQCIEQEQIKEDEITATFSSPTSDPRIWKIIEGHLVNGRRICPLSLLADMALTATKYCYLRMYQDETTPGMSITDVSMHNALVLDPSTAKPIICVTIVLHAEDDFASVTFHSRKDGKDEFHGACKVGFDNSADWVTALNSTTWLLKSRIEVLKTDAAAGKVHRLLKPIVYKLFNETVVYSKEYQGMEDVIVGKECLDAVATIKLPPTTGFGNFFLNPLWIDTLTHLGGFFLNCGLRYNTDETLCMAMGFDTWRFVGELSPDKIYTNYTCMQEEPDSPFVNGDCYIFEGDNLVQAVFGLKFQRLKTATLNALLGAPATSRTDLNKIKPRTTVNKVKEISSVGSFSTRVKTNSVNHNGIKSNGINHHMPMSPPSTDSEGQSRFSSHNGTLHAVTPDSSSTISSILALVAVETGFAIEEMTDEAEFSDMGIDSLMSITIIAATKRDYGLDLEASFFHNYETVRAAKTTLLKRLGAGQKSP